MSNVIDITKKKQTNNDKPEKDSLDWLKQAEEFQKKMKEKKEKDRKNKNKQVKKSYRLE